MYEPLKRFAAFVLAVDLEPPAPPAGGHAQVFRASPSYLTYKLLPFWLGVGLEVLVLAPALAGIIAKGSNPVALAGFLASAGFFAAVTFLGYCALRLDYELRYYIVTDRSLRVREGGFIVREMTLTHANIQNQRIDQGPLQRAFGIADLVVETAGGGAAATNQPGGHGHAAVLAGIENPEEIRDIIRAYAQRRARDAGLGDDARGRKAPAPAGWSPALVGALREVRDAAAGLRAAAAAPPGPGA